MNTIIQGLLVYHKSSDISEQRPELDHIERSHQTLKLTDQYLALLVLVFFNAGLCDVSS
jgi:rapamycin-insensitive companion of mTOR